jgi:hypothetical protein
VAQPVARSPRISSDWDDQRRRAEKNAALWAEQAAAEEGWRYVDENQFEWRLEAEEDLTAVKQAVKNRNTEEVEAESISYAVCQYFGIQTGENSFGLCHCLADDVAGQRVRAASCCVNPAPNRSSASWPKAKTKPRFEKWLSRLPPVSER